MLTFSTFNGDFTSLEQYNKMKRLLCISVKVTEMIGDGEPVENKMWITSSNSSENVISSFVIDLKVTFTCNSSYSYNY